MGPQLLLPSVLADQCSSLEGSGAEDQEDDPDRSVVAHETILQRDAEHDVGLVSSEVEDTFTCSFVEDNGAHIKEVSNIHFNYIHS